MARQPGHRVRQGVDLLLQRDDVELSMNGLELRLRLGTSPFPPAKRTDGESLIEGVEGHARERQGPAARGSVDIQAPASVARRGLPDARLIIAWA
jgi:hypothetical protein